jgi:hypothetical protein
MKTPICEFKSFEIFLDDFLNARQILLSKILVRGETNRTPKYFRNYYTVTSLDVNFRYPDRMS